MSKMKKCLLLFLPIFALLLVLTGCSASGFGNPDNQPLQTSQLSKKEKIAAVLVYGGENAISDTWESDYYAGLKRKISVRAEDNNTIFDFPPSSDAPDDDHDPDEHPEFYPSYRIYKKKMEMGNYEDVVETKSLNSIVNYINENKLQSKVRKIAKNIVIKLDIG